jgi:arylsulfatase A-like enzyme
MIHQIFQIFHYKPIGNKEMSLIRNRNNTVLKTLLLALTSLIFSTLAAQPPNVVLITVSGMGQADASCYGGDWITTDALDRLADEGVLATSAYAAAPTAAGSRYGLMTGSRPQRFGIQSDADADAESPGARVPKDHLLLPEILRRSGYTTGMVGKWNYRTDPEVWFDKVYSPIDWDADYFPDRRGHYPGVWRETKFDKAGIDYGWGPLRDGDEYLTDRLGRQAVSFIEEQSGADPFFLYLAFNAPGRPLQAKQAYQDDVAHLPTEALQLYAAMLLSVDENVGRILDELDRLNIADDTMVIFVSDHGPSYAFNPGWPDHWEPELLGSTGGLRGNMGTFEEGGLRIPMLIRWPMQLDPGTVYQHPASALDIYATVCAAAGVNIPLEMSIDGRNLLPWLSGNQGEPPAAEHFWMEENRGALRSGDWKLIVDHDPNSTVRLYNLSNDPSESEDLATAEANRSNQMLHRWREIADEMPMSFRDLESYFRAVDIARRVEPQALHEIAKQHETEQILQDLGRSWPEVQYLGNDLFYIPSIGFFYTDASSFPKLAHIQWGQIYYYHFPHAMDSITALYILAQDTESGDRLGWLIRLSDEHDIHYAPALGNFVYLPRLEIPEMWLYSYHSEGWRHFQGDLSGIPDIHYPDDPDDPDPDPVDPSLEAYEAMLAEPPDGGSGPALWFRYQREPNYGSAGDWTIRAASPLTEIREDYFGNAEGAFALEPGSTGGAAISGSGGTSYAAGDEGALFLTFNSGSDVEALASIFSKGAFSDADPFEISIFNGVLRLSYRSDSQTKSTENLGTLSPDTWYTVAISWDMGKSSDKLWWVLVEMESGELSDGTVSPSVVGTVANPIRVAGRNGSAPFFGALQNLAIYQRPIELHDLLNILAHLH